MDLFVCPKINSLDPAADGYDGAGHRVSNVASTCHSGREATDHPDHIGCEEQLEPASEAWLKFYGLKPVLEEETNADSDQS